jgi:hypothetical protein
MSNTCNEMAAGKLQRSFPLQYGVGHNANISKHIHVLRIDSLGVELKLPMCLHGLLQVRVRVSVDANSTYVFVAVLYVSVLHEILFADKWSHRLSLSGDTCCLKTSSRRG